MVEKGALIFEGFRFSGSGRLWKEMDGSRKNKEFADR
jgi:hypothetical protein